MVFSLQARIVFPVDGPPIDGGVVTIDGERILSVGTASSGGQIRDLGEVALLPAFVNAHTHLEFSHLRRPLGKPGMPLPDWIRLVIAERGRTDAAAADAIGEGVKESVAAGVATLGEIATAMPEAYGLHRDVRVTLLSEVIGFSRARATSALVAIEQRLAAAARATENHMQLGISPHAPYTVSPELLCELVVLAQRQHLPVAMHLAESDEELQLLAEGRGGFQELLDERSMWDGAAIPAGSRPLDYLRMLAEAPRALVIHGNYLDAEEREFLAGHADRMSLVFCPRTHAFFQHPPYPLAELFAAGVRVALGTDSRASNPDLDLLAEMRQVARLHSKVAPQSILQMATLDGARALGRDDETGRITPGTSADLVALPLTPGARGTGDERLAALLHSDERPCGVWLRGREMARADIT